MKYKYIHSYTNNDKIMKSYLKIKCTHEYRMSVNILRYDTYA